MQIEPVSGEVQAGRSLAELEQEIAQHHHATEAAARTAVAHAIAAGERLVEVKSRVGHGGWLPWLKDHFPASERTAQLYMSLARRPVDAQRVADLGIAGAVRALNAGEASGGRRQRPRLVRRAAELIEVIDKYVADAAAGECRVAEVIEYLGARSGAEAVERARFMQRVLQRIVEEAARRSDPFPPLLCPCCGGVPPALAKAARC